MLVSNRILGQIDTLHDLKTYHVGIIESAAHRALRQHKDTLLRNYGITGVEWYIIGTIADAGSQGIRLTELARMLGTTMGFMTKTMKLLEAKDIVLRTANAADARSSYFILNNNYKKTYEEIEHELRARLRKSIYSLVTPEELTTYIKVLDKFSKI